MAYRPRRCILARVYGRVARVGSNSARVVRLLRESAAFPRELWSYCASELHSCASCEVTARVSLILAQVECILARVR